MAGRFPLYTDAQEHDKRMGYGDLVAKIETLSEPFPHLVIHLKPGRE